MTETPRDDIGWFVRFQQRGCLGVSEVMEADTSEFCFSSSSGLTADTPESSILAGPVALLVLGRRLDTFQWLRTFCCVLFRHLNCVFRRHSSSA